MYMLRHGELVEFYKAMIFVEFKDAQGCARIFKNAQGCARMFKDAQGCARVFKDFQGCSVLARM